MLFGKLVRLFLLFLLFLVCFASLAAPITNFGTLEHLKESHSKDFSSTSRLHHTHGHELSHSHSRTNSQKQQKRNQILVDSGIATLNFDSHGHSFVEFPAFLPIRKSEALAVVFVVAFFAVLLNLLVHLPVNFSHIYSFLKPMGIAPPHSKFRNLPLLN